MDAFSEVLSGVRLKGAMFFSELTTASEAKAKQSVRDFANSFRYRFSAGRIEPRRGCAFIQRRQCARLARESPPGGKEAVYHT
jgi:hypothetical protein